MLLRLTAMGARKQIPTIMFLDEDDLPEVTPLSFFEKLNRIFRLLGFDNAGERAGRPLHGEFSCQYSAEPVRVPRGAGTPRGQGCDGRDADHGERNATGRTDYDGSAQQHGGGSEIGTGGQLVGLVATARVVTAVDGPLLGLGSDKRAGAILGLITALVLACCVEEGPDDNEAFTSGTTSGTTIFHIDVRHCHSDRDRYRLNGEKVWITIQHFGSTKGAPVKKKEYTVNKDRVEVVVPNEQLSPDAQHYYVVRAEHDKYGESSPDNVHATAAEEKFAAVCFHESRRLESKHYSFSKWANLSDEFEELVSVISTDSFKNLKLRSKGWRGRKPIEIFELGLPSFALEREIENVYDYDYTTCEKETEKNKEACHTLVNAKAGLLNLYSALRRSGPGGDLRQKGGTSWWEYIEEIKMIQPDRIVAKVKKDMYDEIIRIRQENSASVQSNSAWEMDTWVNLGLNDLLEDRDRGLNRALGDDSPMVGAYNVCQCKNETKDTELKKKEFIRAIGRFHDHNFKAAINEEGKIREDDPNRSPIFGIKLKSIKSTTRIASLQLTVGEVEVEDGHSYYLLDADIDEHTGYRHVQDWLRHRLLGVYTNPFQIGEMLRNDNNDIELGYDSI